MAAKNKSLDRELRDLAMTSAGLAYRIRKLGLMAWAVDVDKWRKMPQLVPQQIRPVIDGILNTDRIKWD